MTFLEIMGSKTKAVTFSFFPRLNFSLDTRILLLYPTVPDSSRPNVQVHITRQHVNTFSHAVVNFTACVTESVLISF